MQSALRALAHFVVERPRSVLVGALVLTLAALSLLPRFEIDPDIASLFPADHPSIELMQLSDSGQRASRTLFVVLEDSELERVVPLAAEALAASPYLVEVAATREEFLGDAIRRAPLFYLAEDQLERLERRLSDDSERLAAVRESEALLADPFAAIEVVRRDPLGLRWILDSARSSLLPAAFDPDSDYLQPAGESLALVRVVGERDPFDIEYARELLADVEERLAALDLESFELVGGYATARSDAARIRSDLQVSLWFSIPAILLFLGISTRSLTLPHALLLPVVLAILWALAFGGALLGPLTPLSLSAAAIMIGLGVDFTVHYARRFRVECETADGSTAVERTSVSTGRALFAGLTTTLAAFLCFGLGSFRGLRSFGFLLALGLTFAFLATMFLLPILLRRRDGSARERSPEPRSTVIGMVQSIHAAGRGRLLAILLLLVALAGWFTVGVRGLVFDADPTRMRPAGGRLAEISRRVERSLGMSPVAITVLSPRSRALEDVRDASESLRAKGSVALHLGAQVSVPTAARRERVREFRAKTAGWVDATARDLETVGFRAAPFRPALEERAELFAADPAVDEGDWIRRWRGEEYWVTLLYPTEALTERPTRAAFHADVRAAFGEDVLVVDPFGLSDELGPLLRSDLVRAAELWLAVAIFVFLNAGSLPLAIATLVPVLAGLGITLGAVAWFGVPLHPGNFIAIPLILGLGVDDGIHMVLHYRAGAVDALGTTGTAIWRTTATTALGFGSLCSVSTPAIASMGAIVLVGVLSCFAASVLVMPVLFGDTEGHANR